MAACMALNATAQTLPNGTFEAWKSACGDTYSPNNGKLTTAQRPGVEPEGWNGSSVNQMSFVKVELVTRGGDDSDAHVVMTNEFAGLSQALGSNAPAYVTFGNPWVYATIPVSNSDGGTFGGMEYTYKPDALKLSYRRTFGSEDTDKAEKAHIIAYLWNGTFTSTISSNTQVDDADRAIFGMTESTGDGQLIASVDYEISGEYTDWTDVTIPLEYVEANAALTPSKMNVILSSADYWTRSNIKAGNVLEADSVAFVFYTTAKGITIGGTAVEGFSSDVYEYDIPSTDLPAAEDVAVTTTSRFATAEVNVNADNATVAITVTNQGGADADGTTSRTYTLRYEQPVFTTAETITVGGVEVPGFASDTYDYLMQSYDLPTEDEISVDTTSEGVEVDVNIDTDNAIVTITITNPDAAEDEEGAVTTYTLRYYATIETAELPNGGFESWKDEAGDTYTSTSGQLIPTARPGIEPAGWNGSSVNQMGLVQVELVTRGGDDNDAHIVMTNQFAGLSSALGSNAPAYVTYGQPWVYITIPVEGCDGGTFGGVGYGYKPDALALSYRRTFGEEDTDKAEKAHVIAYLWDGTFTSTIAGETEVNDADRAILGMTESTGDGQLIASVDYEISGEHTDWTDVTIPLEYVEENAALTPSKMNVILSSADYWTRANIKAGNVLEADDVRFVFHSTLADVTIDGIEDGWFAPDTYAYELNGTLPAEDEMTVTTAGRFATAETAVDEEDNTITVTVTNQGGADADGETSHTYTFTFTGSNGLDATATAATTVTAADGAVVIRAAQTVDVTVTDLSGRTVMMTTVGAGETRIDMPAGFYVVKAGNTVRKVVVE